MITLDTILNIFILISIGSMYFFKKYLFSFFSEKGNNLATKQDVEEITGKVEGVKSIYSVDLEKIKALLLESSHQKNAVWLIKRDACLKALDIANAVLSNFQYPNIPEGVIPQRVCIEAARSCWNELACTCESSEVIDQFKIILFNENISLDAIVDMRSAVRKELGFGDSSIDLDREKAFICRMDFNS